MPEVERPKALQGRKAFGRSFKGKFSAKQRDYCPFTMVVGMKVLGATGGASPLPYERRGVIVQMQNHTSTHRRSPYEKR